LLLFFKKEDFLSSCWVPIMARLLLVPIVLLIFLAALLPLVAAALAGGHGVAASLADAHVQRAMRIAMTGGVLVAILAVLVGFAPALALWQAAGWARWPALAICVAVLLVPAPGFADLRFLSPLRPAGVLAFCCAVARGAAMTVLILSAGLARVPFGLQAAARSAGARPLRAWLDAVVAPLTWPLAGAALVAFMVGIAEGPAASLLAPHFDLADAWVAPAALLVAAASVAAMSVLLQPDTV
jgi:ABC-type Fe3+ transport system permease subunit